MKTYLALALLAGSMVLGRAATTINVTNNFAYGANVGWVNWRGDATNGAVIGDYVCSGYIYGANVGWITLGNGSPANGIRYQNIAGDCGVNLNGIGGLQGFAWGANIGWIVFNLTNGNPRVDFKTGKFSGYAWSANCGWISLSNAFAYVKTGSLFPGTDANNNGLPDPWELEHFNHLGVDPNGDADNDGASNGKEYLAGTDPNNGSDYLHILSESFGTEGSSATLTWSSVPTRCYYLQKAPYLNPPIPWVDSGLGIIAPDSGTTTTRSFGDSRAPIRFYRVAAVRPLP